MGPSSTRGDRGAEEGDGGMEPLEWRCRNLPAPAEGFTPDRVRRRSSEKCLKVGAPEECRVLTSGG